MIVLPEKVEKVLGNARVQSLSTRTLPIDEVLFEEKGYTVTPSWLELNRHSYTIRDITRLELRDIHPRKTLAMCLLLLVVVGMILVLWRFIGGNIALPFTMLLLLPSAGMFIWASYVLTMQRSVYGLAVHFSTGDPVLVRNASRDLIQRLHEAVTLAMKWHRSNPNPAIHIEASL